MNNNYKNEIIQTILNNNNFKDYILFFNKIDIKIFKKIINDKFESNKIFNIMNKFNNNLDINNLSDDELVFLNDFLNNSNNINLLNTLINLNENYNNINKYVYVINIITIIVTIVIILIFLYLIYDLYLVNKDKTDIDYYLNYGLDYGSNILLLLTILSLKNCLVSVISNIFTILNSLPFSIYLLLFNILITKLILNHKIIYDKLDETNGKKVLIFLILLVISINIYKIYDKINNKSKEITYANFIAYLYNKYIKPNMEYFDIIYSQLIKKL